jgi:mono/diheme cytochrome c family protein
MKKLFFIAGMAVVLGSCYADKYDKLYPAHVSTVDPCDTATNASTYSGNVKAIMGQSCATTGCHDATAAGGYDLTSVTGVQSCAASGLLVSDINSGRMPKSASKLSDCQIKQITYWVNHGALNN